MSTYNKSIFLVMKNIKKIIENPNSEIVFSDEVKEYFYFIDKFIRKGSLGKTEDSKYILRYYDYPDSVLAKNFKRLYDKDIAESTIRTTKFRMNKKFETMFVSASELEDSLMSSNLDNLNEIVGKIKYSSSSDLTMDDFFYSDLIKEIINSSEEYKEYDLEECKTELDFVSKLSKKNIRHLMDKLDKTKLNYIISLLEEPIYNTHSGLNVDKQRLMLLFNNNLESGNTFENVVATKEYIKESLNEDKKTKEIDYKTKYEELLKDYNDLVSKEKEKKIECEEDRKEPELLSKYKKWNVFDEIDLYTSSIFNNEVILPKAILYLMNDIASEHKGNVEFKDINVLELQKVLLTIAKYSIPCIMHDLESLDLEILSKVWNVINSSYNEPTNETVKEYVSAILSSLSYFIDCLSIDKYEYVAKDMQLLLDIKAKAFEDKKANENNETKDTVDSSSNN